MDDTLVTVAMFADVLPAELAKGQLQAEGIAAVVDQSVEHQLWGYALGVVRLKVKESQRDRASEVLDLAARKPNVEVVACSREGSVTRIALKFDILPNESAAPATLYSPDEDCDDEFDVYRIVEVAPSAVTFETYGSDVQQPRVGATYVFCRWWEQDQLDLVKNENIVWRRERFAPSDAVRDNRGALRKFEGGEVADKEEIITGGWQHEDCRLCGQMISARKGQDNFGYTDGTDWMCEACYGKYIASGLRKKLG